MIINGLKNFKEYYEYANDITAAQIDILIAAGAPIFKLEKSYCTDSDVFETWFKNYIMSKKH